MDGFEKLGHTLSGHMNTTFDAKNRVGLEIGLVNADFSLQMPRFETSIPKEDYKVGRNLCVDYINPIQVTTSASSEGHTHSVSIPLPEGVKKIAPGDEVLVAWVGNEPVIICILEKGDVL